MTTRPQIVLVAAVAENGIIGAGNALPFRLSADLKRFKALTLGKAVIMGRKTFDSIGRPLPDRLNIVITRQPGRLPDTVTAAGDLAEALRIAGDWSETRGLSQIMVIGGGEIYAQAMPKADRLEITRVHAEPEGDVRFPDIDPAIWGCTTVGSSPAGERDDHAVTFLSFNRL